MSENSVKGPPFDLHVLSTPPAFILSQDQTLNKMVSKQASRLVQITLLKLSSSFKEIRRCPTKLFKLHGQLIVRFWCFVFLLRCLIYKVHAASVSNEREMNINTSLSVCQEKLLKFFPDFPPLSLSLATASIEYHPVSRLSTPFFTFL